MIMNDIIIMVVINIERNHHFYCIVNENTNTGLLWTKILTVLAFLSTSFIKSLQKDRVGARFLNLLPVYLGNSYYKEERDVRFSVPWRR